MSDLLLFCERNPILTFLLLYVIFNFFVRIFTIVMSINDNEGE